MFTRAHQQSSIYSPIDSLSEIGCARVIKRHNDHATQPAAKEYRHPLCRIRPPQQDALAFPDSTLFQFAGKTERSLGHLPVAPAFHAVPATLYVGALPPSSQKVVKVFDNGAVLHA